MSITVRARALPATALWCVLAFACGAEAPGGGVSDGLSNDSDSAGADDGDDDTGKGTDGAKADGGSKKKDGGADAGSKKPDARVSKGPTDCARAILTTRRVIPQVWLLIDGSGSMSAGLAGDASSSRYAVLRHALLDPDEGLVHRLAPSVAFGLMVYDGGLSPPGVYIPGVCPRVVVVEPALDNYDAINTAYPMDPMGASTPTHYALLDLQSRIEMQVATLNPDDGPMPPSFVLLATDGKPNLCDFHDGIPASAATEQEAVVTVEQLAMAGTKTYALSMAGDDPALQEHLEAVAKAGDTGSDVFTPTNQDAMVAVLTEILGGAQSCDIVVDGTIVPGKECSGEVTFNQMPLVCDDPNGYHIKEDKKTMELLGTSCETLRNTPMSQLSASFACQDILVL